MPLNSPDPMRAPGTIPDSPLPTPNSVPVENASSSDVDRFSDLMSADTKDPDRSGDRQHSGKSQRVDKDGEPAGRDSGEDAGETENIEEVSPGAAILQAMQKASRQISDIPDNVAQKAMPSQDASATVNEISNSIADRILVSDPQSTGQQEVRIQIKDSILPGTEVRIIREAGEVRIQLTTTSDASLSLLAANKAGLQQRLQDRLDARVTVNVQADTGDQPDQQQRSRQQRRVIDELEDT